MSKRYRDVVIRPTSPTIIPYSLQQAVTPCRAVRVIRNSWWVVTEIRVGHQVQEVLLFLDSPLGHIPQESVDAQVIHLMKRILFPWATIRKLDSVYLVPHLKNGWQVPYGRVGGEGRDRAKGTRAQSGKFII